ncbi:MAG: 30S ribosomal protein S12 methylthiotransferase RimO [Thermodesulfovibrionales bacterium]|nr:30S ribosomal protein S12 methylthiotransferase RimO [Thermodesulfovibrionales bacterium]
MASPVRKNSASPVKDKFLQSGHSTGANKFFLISLGCPKNLVDSDTLTEKLISSGLSCVDNPENADILLINTCGFIEDAKKESIAEILKLTELKKGSRHGESPKATKRLIVFGCLAKRYSDELIKEMPEIDAIFGVGEEEKIVEYCKELKGIRDLGLGISKTNPQPLTTNPQSYAYLKIAEGCSRKCAYCVIPSIRGEYKSAAPNEIMKKAESHINAGMKELILIAQDTASYGREFKGYDIANLLKDLCTIRGDFWIRLLYAYPAPIKDPLLNVIVEEKKICKYLDIPFQHSEDRILKLMKRGGSRKGYLNLIRKIRNAIPDVALRTTFIMGFPTETEDEFNSMMDFIEEAQFDRLGAFKYSREEGTPAAQLKGHLSETIKTRRFDTIMKCQSRISLEKNKKLIGRKFKAIVDEIDNGIAIGRLYSHAPEIDGVVIMEDTRFKIQDAGYKIEDKNHASCIVHHASLKLKIGDFVTVEITDVYDYDLKGIIVK